MRNYGRHAILLFFLVTLAAPVAHAQTALSPLSVSKLRLPSADPVPSGRMELGLHYHMGWFAREFGDNGSNHRADALITDAQLGFRLTVGIMDTRYFGMEAGLVLPVRFAWSEERGSDVTTSAVGFGDVPLALKMRVLATNSLSLALAITGRAPTGDRTRLTDGYGRVGGGMLMSMHVAGGLTMDFALLAEGAPGIREVDRGDVPAAAFETSLGFAWLERRGFFRYVTPCLELAHKVEMATRGDSRVKQRLVLNVGFNIQLSRRLLLVQAAQVDLAGTNTPMGAAWFMNATILI